MSQTEVDKLLKKIGKRIFVEYFREFGDPNLSHQDVIALLPQEFTFKSRTSRTAKARRIFREGLVEEALNNIVASERVEPEVIKQADALLTQLRSRF